MGLSALEQWRQDYEFKQHKVDCLKNRSLISFSFDGDIVKDYKFLQCKECKEIDYCWNYAHMKLEGFTVDEINEFCPNRKLIVCDYYTKWIEEGASYAK